MTRLLALALASTALTLAGCATNPAQDSGRIASAANADPLAEGFASPPMEARPRTWWHWMNGNVSLDGIAKDLAWMHRIGLGGFQNFDASLGTPQIVDERKVYMTPEWREAFRFAASEAARLDLEMAIAASPGWSETGGPWVVPADGMKKLVWGETLLRGGEHFSGAITRAPTTTGPYQDIHFEDDIAAISGAEPPAPPQASGTIAVLAVPLAAQPLPAARATLADGTNVDAALLSDGAFDHGIDLPLAGDMSGALNLTYPRDVTVRSLQLSLPGLIRPFRSSPVIAMLEARQDGEWHKVTDLAITSIPTTFGFAPVTASEFRLRVAENSDIIPLTEMDGAEGAMAFDIFAFGDMTSISVAEFSLGTQQRLNRAEEKAGYASVYDYYAIMSDDETPVSLGTGDVVDLSAMVAPDGTLEWTPPAGGDWLVLDFGWSLTGKTNHPAPPEATGLEVDKFDPAAVRRYLEHYLGMYRETVGDDLFGERGLQALLTDSIEVGFANWTPAMEAQFEARRGYSLRPWLPALTGVVIGSEAETEAFLYDWRDTLAEMLADNHYGTVAEVAHENGLIVYGEALEDKRPILGDDLTMRRHADVPMAALWTWPRDGHVRTTLLGDMKGAASTAHVYGQRFVAAESMTSANSPWAFSPRDLRRIIDLEFVSGINRPVIHTSVHVPVEDRKPGLSLMIFGQHFNRNETWADMAGPWITYLSRNSYMLQQGNYFADIAWLRGEEAPVTAQFATSVPEGLPREYAYDFVNADMLVDAFSVEDGMLVTPGGTRYRALVLGPDTSHMTLPTLRRIGELVAAGATVIGKRPSATPSLADDAAEFEMLSYTLWEDERVIATADYADALADLGVGPDFSWTGGATDAEILFLHRLMDDGSHLYFLSNRQNRSEQVEARFRVTGFAPELWDAVSGTSRPLSYRVEGDHTVIPLTFTPEESAFVVFRQPTSALSAEHPETLPRAIAMVEGAWDVAFQPGRGAPGGVRMEALAPLNESANEGIRYFSGIASYTTTMDLADLPAGERVLLDLGQVGDVAEVWVNGSYAGTSWFAPDRVDITDQVQPGENRLEVRVANRWVNRLIGDQQPGADKVTFTAAPTYRADATLRPSGLVGPVKLLIED